ncbi:unnamed protein product [Cylindrotheca closterium]|uniref:Glucokinase n=1 Tax=Cylindrotheca closterium TaxID=2856 RepID=A0AAD2JJX0_9STRA|nr:unnamed protein product [Cylindrotheca closterium]
MSSLTPYLLTADVGGTNSRMGLYCIDSTEPLAVKYYRNEDCLTQKEDGIFEKNVIIPFLRHCWESNSSNLKPLEEVEIIGCLAIAGPVRSNVSWMSNLHNIEIDGSAIAEHTHVKNDLYLERIKVCKIINDFVAQGYGCLTLKPDEMVELKHGSFDKMDCEGPKVCIGAGTGLGECFLTPDSQGRYTCYPSEGGHVEWAPRNELEIELWNYLRDKFSYRNRLSVERIVSGPGLANVYEFLAFKYPGRIDPKVHAEFEKETDMKAKVVAMNTKERSLCLQAMEIMMGAYGSEAGSSAIKFIPTGGLFVTGGLTPKNIKFIEGQDSPFMKAYNDKGRVKPILEYVPAFAVLTEDLGVRGAHKCAVQEYETYLNEGEQKRKRN